MAETTVTGSEGATAPEEPDYDDVVSSADSALGRMRDLHDALVALRVDGHSESRDIHVTVDGSGALLDLTLAPAALSRPAAELGRVIVETAEAAARDAFVRHGELVREHGADREPDKRQ